jgi:hypothetical protein
MLGLDAIGVRDRVLVRVERGVWAAWTVCLGVVTGFAHRADEAGIIRWRIGVRAICVDRAKRERWIVIELCLVEAGKRLAATAAAAALLTDYGIDLHPRRYGGAVNCASDAE